MLNKLIDAILADSSTKLICLCTKFHDSCIILEFCTFQYFVLLEKNVSLVVCIISCLFTVFFISNIHLFLNVEPDSLLFYSAVTSCFDIVILYLTSAHWFFAP